MVLKNRLRELRFQNNEMSQTDLADRVGVSRMTIYSIEKNKYVPSALLALKICMVFEKKFEDVFYIERSDKSE